MELLTALFRQAFKLALSLLSGQCHMRASLSGPWKGESPEQGGKTTETRQITFHVATSLHSEKVAPLRFSAVHTTASRAQVDA